ncbi:antibiotic biosynthesis monooxygenase [Granulicella sp. 5B5]|nr:putative quinol monooxygenase [Granulicella sp. 5B5]QMV20379.1 antibiotic biosynthesis monooxygenase [Granulicella sp. 5B5]
MVSFTVRMTFRAEDRAEIAEALRVLAVESRKEPGCVSYVPHTVESSPDTVLIYEQYMDEAAVEHHRGTAHFAKYAIGGLYQKMLERQVEVLVALA